MFLSVLHNKINERREPNRSEIIEDISENREIEIKGKVTDNLEENQKEKVVR